MGDLWARYRKSKFAGFYRYVSWWLSHSGIAKLAVRIFARRFSRNLHRHPAHPDREADRAHQKRFYLEKTATRPARPVANFERTTQQSPGSRRPARSANSIL